jgi:hypothetical protein
MNDSELRNLFHQLRDEERPSPFRSAAAKPPLSKRRLGAALRYAVVIVIVIAVALSYRRPEPTESILTWTAPTDVLLRTPGSELLTTVPRIPDLPERK